MGKHSVNNPIVDRATVRTVFQAFVGLCFILPALIPLLGVSTTAGWVVAALAVSGAITRVMQFPAFNAWLDNYFPWLSKDSE